MIKLLSLSLCITILALVACDSSKLNSSDSIDQQKTISQQVFSDSVSNFIVNIIYEAGAEPYLGAIGVSGNDTWDITEESYKELFTTHTGRTITVPRSLGDMTEIADQGKSNWSQSELLSLGNSLSPSLLDGTTIRVTLIFLEGIYDNYSSILGVHFTGSRYAFVFKDVVESVGGDPVTQRYVEQGTAVHEIGHLIGLVDNGVPMAVNHDDSTHPKHTNNNDGVMYWAVESSDNILSSITDLITGNSLQIFGAQSLADGQSYHP